MSVRLFNPYSGKTGRWVRGNFHGHCSENSGCSSVRLADGVRRYHNIGARFMAVTDHDRITDLARMKAAYPDMVFLEGFEYSRCENFLVIGEAVPPLHECSPDEAMARATELLTIICHPEPRPGEGYWTRDKILFRLRRMPDGIEVYNGHYGVEDMASGGCGPLYTRFWDELLSAGHRVWGFANDDFHDPADFDNAFNMVLVEELTAAAIISAAKDGCFYGSTGLLVDRISETDGRITITTAAPCVGRFVGPGGAVLAQGEGTRFEFTTTHEVYVRFEAEGEAGRLFLQPMFREAE